MLTKEQWLADRENVYETAKRLGMNVMVGEMDKMYRDDGVHFMNGEVRTTDEMFSHQPPPPAKPRSPS